MYMLSGWTRYLSLYLLSGSTKWSGALRSKNWPIRAVQSDSTGEEREAQARRRGGAGIRTTGEKLAASLSARVLS
jgi:hypothetical protein